MITLGVWYCSWLSWDLPAGWWQREKQRPGHSFHHSLEGGQDASFVRVTVCHHQAFWKLINLSALTVNRPSKEGWYRLKFKQLKCGFGSLHSYSDDQSFTSEWLIRYLRAGRFNPIERWHFLGIMFYIQIELKSRFAQLLRVQQYSREWCHQSQSKQSE